MVLKGPRSTLLGTPSLVRGEIKIWLYLPSFPSPPLLHLSLFLTHRYTVIYIYIHISSFLSSIPIHHLQLSPSASSVSLLPSLLFFGYLLLLLSPRWIRYATAVKFICLLV